MSESYAELLPTNVVSFPRLVRAVSSAVFRFGSFGNGGFAGIEPADTLERLKGCHSLDSLNPRNYLTPVDTQHVSTQQV
jgi:hypothetical protein